jgi:hypothetical protein
MNFTHFCHSWSIDVINVSVYCVLSEDLHDRKHMKTKERQEVVLMLHACEVMAFSCGSAFLKRLAKLLFLRPPAISCVAGFVPPRTSARHAEAVPRIKVCTASGTLSAGLRASPRKPHLRRAGAATFPGCALNSDALTYDSSHV